MERAASYILETTASVILLTWVILHADAFVTVISAGSNALVGGVKALWGPQGK